MTITETVRAAMKRAPKSSPAQLASITGLGRQQIYNALREIRDPDYCTRWRTENADRYKDNERTRYLRNKARRGAKPTAEVLAERRREKSEKLEAPVLDLVRKDRSFSKTARALGLTRDAVAGRKWRADERMKKQGGADHECG